VKLDTILSDVHSKVLPFIDAYTLQSTTLLSDPTQTPTPDVLKSLKQKHAQIGELLLQALFKVDGVGMDGIPEGSEEEAMARAKRKAVVKELNGLLEGVDGVKEKVEEWGKKGGKNSSL
jgi:hypothetical protein